MYKLLVQILLGVHKYIYLLWLVESESDWLVESKSEIELSVIRQKQQQMHVTNAIV